MRRLLVGFVIVVFVAFSGGDMAEAKSFSIERLEVDAVLNSDASMSVVEHLTYSFAGSFTQGTRPIPGGDYKIVDMRVSERGVQLPTEGAPNNLSWRFGATNERRTFDISYRVLNVAKVGPDVGELYWKFMGTEHAGFGEVDVNLKAPSADQLRAWGHGPLNGVVSINGDAVNLSVSPLPANTFVEARVVLPASVFAVAPTGGERLPKILAEEKANADDANAQRGFTDKPDAPEHSTLFNVLSVLASALAIAIHIFIWRRWGREPKRPEDVGRYWYEPPEVAPATVVATTGEGDRIAGTLVDLAQRGYLAIEETKDNSGVVAKIMGGKDDWRLTRQKPEDSELLPFERRLLRYIFDDGSPTTQSELRERSKKNTSAASEFIKSFESEVKESVDGVYWAEGTGVAKALNILLAIALGGLGFIAIANEAWLGSLCFLVAIVIAFLSKNLSRRTEFGARKAAEWNALKAYLHDFSNFKDAPIGHMILWERYLVYGVAFGVAEELAEGFKMRAPQESESRTFAPWYVGSTTPGDLGRIAGLSALGAGVTSAMTPPSSSSGSGGAFSGGGGGGGGGGGAGAN